MKFGLTFVGSHLLFRDFFISVCFIKQKHPRKGNTSLISVFTHFIHVLELVAEFHPCSQNHLIYIVILI